MSDRPEWIERTLLHEFMRPEHAPMSQHGYDERTPDDPVCTNCPVPAYVVLTPDEIAANQAESVWVELKLRTYAADEMVAAIRTLRATWSAEVDAANDAGIETPTMPIRAAVGALDVLIGGGEA